MGEDMIQQWFDGSGVPSRELGKANDYYLNIANGDVFKKINQIWIRIGCLRGTDGTNGIKGDRGPQGQPGYNGYPGRDGENGNRWYNGVDAPDKTIGRIGDLYLDLNTGDVYEKINFTDWERIGNIRGEDGAPSEEDWNDLKAFSFSLGLRFEEYKMETANKHDNIDREINMAFSRMYDLENRIYELESRLPPVDTE